MAPMDFEKIEDSDRLFYYRRFNVAEYLKDIYELRIQ